MPRKGTETMKKIIIGGLIVLSFMLFGCDDDYLNGPLDKSCQGVQDLRDCTP